MSEKETFQYLVFTQNSGLSIRESDLEESELREQIERDENDYVCVYDLRTYGQSMAEELLVAMANHHPELYAQVLSNKHESIEQDEPEKLLNPDWVSYIQGRVGTEETDHVTLLRLWVEDGGFGIQELDDTSDVMYAVNKDRVSTFEQMLALVGYLYEVGEGSLEILQVADDNTIICEIWSEDVYEDED